MLKSLDCYDYEYAEKANPDCYECGGSGVDFVEHKGDETVVHRCWCLPDE